MSGRFEYQKLDRSRHEIRLLELLPAHHHQSKFRPACRVFHTSLDGKPSYLALSYVWGSGNDTTIILVDKRPFRVTRNLYEAMTSLRGTESIIIWIDAISINQQDNEEKGIQVRMMRTIYNRAAGVILWLGKQEKHDKAAVRLMNTFIEKHKISSNLESFRGKSLAQIGLPWNDCGWIGWASLLSRPWFGRVWVVQEFLNATQSVFMTGDLKIPSAALIWFAFATGACAAIGVAVALHSVTVLNNRDLLLRAFALSIDTRLRAIGELDDTRIVDLWTRSQLLEATDPRDRVFALLSTQTTVSMDIIDYQKDVATVYTEIADIALAVEVRWTDWYRVNPWRLDRHPRTNRKERTSRFLACKTESSHLPSLPSWVPDWRPLGFRFVPLTRHFPGTAWFTHDCSHAVVRGQVLFISGCIIDRPSIIVESSPYAEMDLSYRAEEYPREHSRTQSWFTRVLNWQILCYLLAQSYGTISTKQKFLEDFSRAMAFNALPDRSTSAGVQYVTGFQALHSKVAMGFRGAVKHRLAFPNSRSPTDQDVIYKSVVHELSAGRKFVITNNGDFAWVPRSTRLRDCICFFVGCAVPFVIRPTGKSWELLGDCYLHSRMKDGSISIDVEPQQFEIR